MFKDPPWFDDNLKKKKKKKKKKRYLHGIVSSNMKKEKKLRNKRSRNVFVLLYILTFNRTKVFKMKTRVMESVN